MRKKFDKRRILYGATFLFATVSVFIGAAKVQVDGFYLRNASRVADEAVGLIYPVVIKGITIFLDERSQIIYKVIKPVSFVFLVLALAAWLAYKRIKV